LRARTIADSSARIDTAVDAAELVGTLETQRLDTLVSLPVLRDEIGEVVLALGVVGGEIAQAPRTADLT
jgi:hypothetical protein